MNADQQVSVQYATSNGTARAGTNYAATSGTLTFAPGQFYSQIVVADSRRGTRRSPGGTFSISLFGTAGASIGAISVVQVSITSGAVATVAAAERRGQADHRAGRRPTHRRCWGWWICSRRRSSATRVRAAAARAGWSVSS